MPNAADIAALTDSALKIADAIANGVSEYQIPNVDRDNFARSVATHFHAAGFNVAVIHPSSSGTGHASQFDLHPKWGFSTLTYRVYLGCPGTRMVATNHGDGGFINWAYHGNVESRDGGTVVFK